MTIETKSIHIIKKELEQLPKEVVMQYCLRLAKYKKDNKELLNYLLFEAQDEQEFINHIKEEISAAFATVNRDTMYYAKKNIQRINRFVKKYIKYSGNKHTEIELLMYFCQQMRCCGVSFKESKVMVNLYERQIKTIDKTLSGLHEDIRFDFQDELEEIRSRIT